MNFDQQIYGTGVIRNTIIPDLTNSAGPLIREVGNDKSVIAQDAHIKVDPKIGKNYYKDYMNQAISKMNTEEQKKVNIEEGSRYMEEVENLNLDFDGDGQNDFDFGKGLKVDNPQSVETQEELVAEPSAIQEKSIVKPEVEKVDKESVSDLKHIEEGPTLEGNKDIKLNNVDTQKGTTISINDMVQMGGGALALGMMLLSKNLKSS